MSLDLQHGPQVHCDHAGLIGLKLLMTLTVILFFIFMNKLFNIKRSTKERKCTKCFVRNKISYPGGPELFPL